MEAYLAFRCCCSVDTGDQHIRTGAATHRPVRTLLITHYKNASAGFGKKITVCVCLCGLLLQRFGTLCVLCVKRGSLLFDAPFDTKMVVEDAYEKPSMLHTHSIRLRPDPNDTHKARPGRCIKLGHTSAQSRHVFLYYSLAHIARLLLYHTRRQRGASNVILTLTQRVCVHIIMAAVPTHSI